MRFDRIRPTSWRSASPASAPRRVAGSADTLQVRISGRGNYLGENLAYKWATLSVSGAGDVELGTNKELTASVSGVANVDFWAGARSGETIPGSTT